MNGTLVEVGGVTSATIPRKTVTDKRFVVCKVIFSPHSEGNENPKMLPNKNKMAGIIQFIP